MIERNSKLVKLRKQQERLKFWDKHGDWILVCNALISILLIAPCVMAPISAGIAFAESLYFCSSILALAVHDKYGQNKIKDKIRDIECDIIKYSKCNVKECAILREYDKIEELEKDTIKQRRLVREMLQENRINSKKQKRLIRELTRKKKSEAKEQATMEVLNQDKIKTNENCTPEELELNKSEIN